jgi:ATP-dependent exoDNAse (exonuclease V) beta subunit
MLTVNFRSSRPVIDWNNATFAEVLPRIDDATAGAVSFAPSVAAPRATTTGGVQVHALLARDRWPKHGGSPTSSRKRCSPTHTARSRSS